MAALTEFEKQSLEIAREAVAATRENTKALEAIRGNTTDTLYPSVGAMDRALAFRRPDPANPPAKLYAIVGSYTYAPPEARSTKYQIDLSEITVDVEALFQENGAGWRCVNVRIIDDTIIRESAQRSVRKSFGGQYEDAERSGDTQRVHVLNSQAAPIIDHAVYVASTLPVMKSFVPRLLGHIPGFAPRTSVEGEGGFFGKRGGGSAPPPTPRVQSPPPQIDAPSSEPVVAAITNPMDPRLAPAARKVDSDWAEGAGGPARGKSHVDDFNLPPAGSAAR